MRLSGRSRGAAMTAGVAALALALAIGGCGSGGESTGGSGPATASTGPESGATKEGGRLSRGIKGEDPTSEAATGQRIDRGDCSELARAASGAVGESLSSKSTPEAPLSKCHLTGKGVEINLSLDSGFAAHMRYRNRMVETAQFGAPDPDKVPHPVPNVGAPSTYDANWLPGVSTLFAARGNRWLTVAWSVPGDDNEQARDGAAALARLAFRLTVN